MCYNGDWGQKMVPSCIVNFSCPYFHVNRLIFCHKWWSWCLLPLEPWQANEGQPEIENDKKWPNKSSIDPKLFGDLHNNTWRPKKSWGVKIGQKIDVHKFVFWEVFFNLSWILIGWSEPAHKSLSHWEKSTHVFHMVLSSSKVPEAKNAILGLSPKIFYVTLFWLSERPAGFIDNKEVWYSFIARKWWFEILRVRLVMISE